MVRLFELGLYGFVLLAQYASAQPELLEKRAISKYTTSYTTTYTTVGGAAGQRTRTVTEEIQTVVRTRVKNTKTKATKTKSTKMSTTTASNPNATPGACAAYPDGTYVDDNGVSWTVHCGVDYYGGDLNRMEGPEFGECFDFCGKEAECVAFSWVGQGTSHVGPEDCYLESTLEGGVANDRVDGAFINQR